MSFKELKAKPKSAHDIGDPSLLSRPSQKEIDSNSSDSDREEPVFEKAPVNLDSIKSKLNKKADKSTTENVGEKPPKNLIDKQIKKKEIQEEIRQIQRELVGKQKTNSDLKELTKEKTEDVEVVLKYKEEISKYEHLRKRSKTLSKESKNKEEMVNLFISGFGPFKWLINRFI